MMFGKLFATPYAGIDDIVLNADALFRSARSKDLRDVIDQKIEDLRHYDVLGMERVVAIGFWGRSGSVLMASHLDGHDDVLMLPGTVSDGIHKFYELSATLPLHQKLLAFPAMQKLYDITSEGAGVGGSFFDGPFAISPAQYYAAVQAIVEVSGQWPQEFLTSRRALFLFIHLAYSLALGRRPASTRPLIVCALHWYDNARAMEFVADFPRTLFIHMIRDPITSFDRFFDWLFDPGLLRPIVPIRAQRATVARVLQPSRDTSDVAAWRVVRAHIVADQPYSGMASRTRAIRFEDLHSDTAQIMRDLAAWLGISFQASLLESTFNRIPYVVTRDGKTWSGARKEKAQRSSRHLSRMDRALVYSVFYENFVGWTYPCPRIFGRAPIRFIALLLLPLWPMKMELIVVRTVFKRRVLPALRQGHIVVVFYCLIRMLASRLAIASFFMREALRRLIDRKTLLQIIGQEALTPSVDREASGAATTSRSALQH
jgi:hypothetical protein